MAADFDYDDESSIPRRDHTVVVLISLDAVAGVVKVMIAASSF